MFFAVAPQTVRDPLTGTSVRFDVDAKDSSRCYCYITLRDTNDYLRLTFSRQGHLLLSEMVDAEVEADRRAREAALARQGVVDPALVGSEEARKVADEAAAKRAEEDRALLASEPKVSRYSVDGAPPVVRPNLITPADLHEARQLGYAVPGEYPLVTPPVINTADTLKSAQLGTEAERQAAAGGPSLGVRADDVNNPPARPPVGQPAPGVLRSAEEVERLRVAQPPRAFDPVTGRPV